MTPFERRLVDVEAARLLRALVAREVRSNPTRVWQRMAALVDALHHKVCVEACSWDDAIDQIEATRPSPEPTRLEEIPDVSTPTERPRGKRPGWWPW